LADHATVDAGLSDSDLFGWGRWITSNDISPTPMYTVPVAVEEIAEAGAVLQLGEDWATTVAAFESGTAPPPPGIGDDRVLAQPTDRGAPQGCRAG
jgi:hypothetical protein